MKTQSIFYVKKALLLMMAFMFSCALWAQDLPTKRIMDILIDGSDLWLAGDAGVIKYDKTTGEQIVYRPFFTGDPYSYTNTTLKLAKDHEGNLWVASYGNGIGKFDGKIWTIYSSNQGNFPQNSTATIIVDKENNKWIGSPAYLIKFNDEKWKTWRPEIWECECSSQPFISAMALDHDGVMWIGGYSYPCGTFGKFTGDGFEFYNVDEPDQYLGIGGVTSIAVDKRNNIWVSGNGLRKYDRKEFTTYTPENSTLPSSAIYDIEVDNAGNLWFAGPTCLMKFDGTTFTQYEIPNIKPFIPCIAIEDNGDIWVGTYDDGLLLFSNGEFQPIEIDLSVSIDETDKPARNDAFTVFSNASEIVVDFSLTEAANVSLSVFDMQGKEVCSILRNNDLISGKHQYSCTHTRFSSGVYLVRYVVNGVVNVKKVMVP
jgi:ligand-binding sensor domain-containing protein